MGDQEEFRLGRHREKYCVVWYDASGDRKRHSLGTDDRALADTRLAEFRRIKRVQLKGGSTTVSAIYEAYATDRELAGIAAAPRIRDAWKRLSGTFGNLLPCHVTPELCGSYQRARRAAKVSNGTIHIELGYLRTALKFARKRGWILHTPFVAMPTKPPPREGHLSRDDARKLIAAASLPHVRLFLILALTTAGRAGAILDLTWDRINFIKRTIDLRNPTRDETNKGRAFVAMNDRAFNALMEAQKGAVSGHVVEWGGGKVASVKKGVAGAASRSGIKCSPHVLRHTAAVWMAEAGVPMEEIASYLGHTDTKITFRVYARYSPTYLRKAASALEF
jgi:integrase